MAEWPAIGADHPLSKLLAELPSLLETAAYDEIYGIKLDASGSFQTKLILQKFLRANSNDVDKAKNQLLEALKWRKTYEPLKALHEKFSRDKFNGLGYVTVLEKVPGSENEKDVCTFNVYGAVKDNQKTFGDLDEFMRWRIALMELGIAKLDLQHATKPIPDFGQGVDPYQGVQVHEYNDVSFLRQSPLVKAASSKAIEIFSAYYPETLSRKFFVSVPLLMSWLYKSMTIFLSAETVKKFKVMSYRTELAAELGPSVPIEYGGVSESMDTIGETLVLDG